MKHRQDTCRTEPCYEPSAGNGAYDMMDGKKLCKSSINRKIAGVCGGIGEYLNVDPTLVRLVWVLFAFCGGCGLLAYIIAAIIMPD